MTHIVKHILASVVLMLCGVPLHAAAFDATAPDGNVYTFTPLSDDPTAVSVKCKTKNNGTMVVPATITDNGTTYTVTTIVTKAFYNIAPSSITLPNTVTTLEYRAFYFCKADAINLGTGITAIPDRCFDNCQWLTSMTLPASVAKLGDYIFNQCTRLTSLTLTDPNVTWGSKSILGTPSNDTWTGCKIKNLTLPIGMTTLPTMAFKDMPLETFNCPSSITAIPDFCFQSCTSLSSVTLPSTLTAIGQEAFNGCKVLTSIDIPSSVTVIPNNCFNNCEKLTSVTLPERLTSIGDYAFAHCLALEGLQIPSTVNTMGGNVFLGCSKLLTLDIPEGVTTLNIDLFHDCTSLRSVGIPASVTEIKNNAFQNCYKLESVTLPGDLTSIAPYTFNGCGSLTHVDLPTKVCEVANNAFEACGELRYVSLPMIQADKAGYANELKDCENLDTIEVYSHVKAHPTDAETTAYTKARIPLVYDGYELDHLILHGRTTADPGVTLYTVNFEGSNNEEYMHIGTIACMADGDPSVPVSFEVPLSNFTPITLTLQRPLRDASTALADCDGVEWLNLAQGADMRGETYASLTGLKRLRFAPIPGAKSDTMHLGTWNQTLDTIRVDCLTPPVAVDATFTQDTYEHCVLIVPGDRNLPLDDPYNVAIRDAYANAPGWENFFEHGHGAITGVHDLETAVEPVDHALDVYYDLQGHRADHPEHGVFIERHPDGTAAKVLR